MNFGGNFCWGVKSRHGGSHLGPPCSKVHGSETSPGGPGTAFPPDLSSLGGVEAPGAGLMVNLWLIQSPTP